MKLQRIIVLLLLLLSIGCKKTDDSQDQEKKETGSYNKSQPYTSKSAYPDALTEVKDESTHLSAEVSNDGKWVRVLSEDGKVLWEKNVIRQYGEPAEGKPVIRKVKIDAKFEYIEVMMGDSARVRLDLKTGDYIDYYGA